MQPEQGTDATVNRTSSNKTLKTIALILVILIVIAASAYAGYYYRGTSKNTAATTSQTTTPVTTNATEQSFHTVKSYGTVLGSNVKVSTSFAAPNMFQAIQTPSTIQDPGWTDVLAVNFNSEMGRWKLADPNDAYYSARGDVSLLNISDEWLSKTTTYEGFGYDTVLKDMITPTMTPAQKTTFIATLKKETESCASSEKGFVISSFMNVCYEPVSIAQAAGAYSPQVSFRGYGEHEGKKYIFLGYVSAYDSTSYTADQKTAFQTAFRTGNIPEQTKKMIATITDSVKNTKITFATTEQ